jgi:hypothetical protein
MVKGCYSSPVTLILPDFPPAVLVLEFVLVGSTLTGGSGLPMLNSVLLEAPATGSGSLGLAASVGTGGALGAEGAGKSPDSLIAGFLEVTVVPSPTGARVLLVSLAAEGRSEGEGLVDVVGALRDSMAIGLT